VIPIRGLEDGRRWTLPDSRNDGTTAYVGAPVPTSLDRAASRSWRLLVCAASALAVIVVLRYLSVIVLPVMFALTIAPALTPVAGLFRKRLGRPAAAVALLFGFAVVASLIAIVTLSVVAQADELSDSLSEAMADIVDVLEGEPFNLSLGDSEDVRSSLGGLWDEASGYAVAGVQAGIAVVGGVVLAVAIL
jgi:putative heme transporter